MHGGRGGGKTRCLCLKAVDHASIRGNLVLLCRKRGTDLRATTLRTLLKPSGNLPAVLPEGAYEHNKNERVVHVLGGGDIMYFGFDDEQRLGSLEPGCIAIDEARECAEEEYLMLLGGLRNAADPNPQMLVATNPSARSHFLFDRFKPEHPDERPAGRDSFFLSTDDNTTLDPRYIDALRTMPVQYRKRFYEGKWGEFEGMVWQNFNRELHVVDRAPDEFVRFFAGVDYGYSNPFYFGLFGEDEQGAFHLIDELHQSQLLQTQQIEKSIALAARYGALDDVYIDPSAASLRGAFRNAGLNCIAANNDVLDGIAKVQGRLEVAHGLGRPMLTFAPRCRKTIAEIEGYVWSKNQAKDMPVKEHDHACDGIRYAIATIDRVPVKFHLVDVGDGNADTRARDWLVDPGYQGVRVRGGDEWCRVDNEAIWSEVG